MYRFPNGKCYENKLVPLGVDNKTPYPVPNRVDKGFFYVMISTRLPRGNREKKNSQIKKKFLAN